MRRDDLVGLDFVEFIVEASQLGIPMTVIADIGHVFGLKRKAALRPTRRRVEASRSKRMTSSVGAPRASRY